MPETAPRGPVFRLGGRDVPRRTVLRSMALGVIGTCLGTFFFGLAAGNLFNRFIEFAGHKQELDIFLALPGLVGVLTLAGTWLLQKTGRRRLYFFLQAPARLLWLLIACLPELVPGRELRLALLLALTLIFWVEAGLGGSAWFSWMRDLVPQELRGKYWGCRASAVMLVGGAAGLFEGWLLERLGLGARAFRVVYTIGAVGGVLDILIFAFVHHPPMSVKRGPETSLPRMLRAAWRPEFARFTAVQALWFFTNAVGFLAYYNLVRAIGMEICLIQWVDLTCCAVWVTFSLLWGLFADRYGAKAAYCVGMISHLVGTPVAALGAFWGPLPVFIGAVVANIGVSAVMLADTVLIFEYSSREDQAMAVSVRGLVIGLVGAAGYLLAGRVLFPLLQPAAPSWAPAGTFHLLATYGLVTALRLASVYLGFRLPEVAGGGRRTRAVVWMFYTTNPLRAIYSLARFARAKGDELLADGRYARRHPSSRWRMRSRQA